MTHIKRTPDKWYYNIYDNGRLVHSSAFTRKELAESFARSVAEVQEHMIARGAKRRPGVEDRVEEAKAWSIKGKEFSDFNEALQYMWETYPNEVCIKGVF